VKGGGLGGNPIAHDKAHDYRGLAFYCGQQDATSIHKCLHERTCFNHLVGLPVSKSTGKALPVFDYEMFLFDEMEGNPTDYEIPHLRTMEGIGGHDARGAVKYLAIKKSRGLGISEFFLRYMAYLGVCHNSDYKGMRFFIVCGPGEAVAVELINRVKAILEPLNIIEDTQYNIARFLSVEIYARPGTHVATLRGYDNIKFILVDEASFWVSEDQARELRSVVEGYIAKSRPTIAIVSTPNIPGIMYEQIMEESERTCLYKRYFMPYQVGLDKVYTREDIKNAEAGPNFQREYNLKYGVGVGNIFDDKQIDDILIPLTYQQDPSLQEALPILLADKDTSIIANRTSAKVTLRHVSVGCDPGFGSSDASYVITAQLDHPFSKIIVLEAKKFNRSSFRWFANLIFDKYMEWNATKIFVDASARDVVDDLKIAFRELTQYEIIQSQARQDYSYDPDSWMHRMVVCPIPFNKYNDRMLQQVVSLVQDRMILIPREFEDLILDLRMAREKAGKLDKTGANGMDLLDALRLACLMYQYTR